tara:strand:- start:3571 stop:4881 length:1311 start_codon:yes stop_codon:yes gene_type:complete
MQKLTIDSTRESILNAALMGVEFEFYSDLDLEVTRKSLAKLLDRKIRLEDKAHSDFVPSATEFKIEPDMSGGKGLCELVTGPIPYRNARIMVIKVLNWISENGYTSDRASIHINLSFDKKYLQDKDTVLKMNVLKFILEFDEKQVYKFFPSRKDSTYAKSVKWVMPKWEAFHFDANQIASNNFKFADTKYYGINFSKKEKNYLEFRYLGGEEYEKRSEDILYLTENFLMQMWSSCNDSRFSPENKIELQRILNKNQPISDLLKDHQTVSKNWPDIHILTDLQDDPIIVKVHWERFKNRVMDLIVNGSMTAGIINYDSDYGAVQVKDGKFPTIYQLDNFEFIDCEIAGNVTNSSFYGCDIMGSTIQWGSLYKGTKAKESKIESSYTHGSCDLTNCYVSGRDTMFKGKMIGGIFREGFMTDKARFEDTEIVVSKKIKE